MKKLFLSSILGCVVLSCGVSQESHVSPQETSQVTSIAGSISVKLKKKKLTGELSKRLYVSVFSEEYAGEFGEPEAKNFVFAGKVTTLDNSFVLNDISPGRYAISLYLDEDNNGELNTKELLGKKGVPSERFGFSNNISGNLLNLPKLIKFTKMSAEERFEAASFTVEEGKETQLKIKLRKL